jgi:hypothetical protein
VEEVRRAGACGRKAALMSDVCLPPDPTHSEQYREDVEALGKENAGAKRQKTIDGWLGKSS